MEKDSLKEEIELKSVFYLILTPFIKSSVNFPEIIHLSRTKISGLGCVLIFWVQKLFLQIITPAIFLITFYYFIKEAIPLICFNLCVLRKQNLEEVNELLKISKTLPESEIKSSEIIEMETNVSRFSFLSN